MPIQGELHFPLLLPDPSPAASFLEPQSPGKKELRQENLRKTHIPQSREPGVGFPISPLVFQWLWPHSRRRLLGALVGCKEISSLVPVPKDGSRSPTLASSHGNVVPVFHSSVWASIPGAGINTWMLDMEGEGGRTMSKGGAFNAMRIGKGLLPPSVAVGRIGDVRDPSGMWDVPYP